MNDTPNNPADGGTGAPRLVGREQAAAALRSALAGQGKALVVGPPGAGKTHLIEVCLHESGGDGMPARAAWCRVDLRGVEDDEAAVRGLGRQAGADLEDGAALAEAMVSVTAALEGEAEGLWIDGAESVAGRDVFWRLLDAHLPDIGLVVASRRQFRVRGAETIEVGSLAPEAAVRLFEWRARQVEPTFEADDDREAVEALVERLDRLPLPIELAASRIGVLAPGGLLERFEQRFDLLEGGPGADRGFAEALSGAWELLEGPERACLRQCSVFEADFSFDAVERVVDLDGEEERADLLNVVDRLVRANWLKSRRSGDGTETRFDLWENMRAFGRRRLQEAGDPDAVWARYAAFYRSRAHELAGSIPTPDGQRAREQLGREAPHLLALIDRTLEAEPAVAAELVWALRWNARFGSLREEVRERLAVVGVEGWEALEDRWTIRMLSLWGELAFRLDRREQASELLERARGLASRTDDAELAAGTAAISSLALASVDPGAAEDRLRDALPVVSEGEAPVVEGRLRERLGFVQLQTFRLEEARQSFRRARKVLTSRANPLIAAPATTGLAYVARRTGHGNAAATAFEETVRIYVSAGDPSREAEARFNHAVALHGVGHVKRARDEVERALEIWSRRGRTRYETIGRVRLALIIAETAPSDRAREAFDAAIGAGQRHGDWHNRAIAEAGRVLVGLVDGERGLAIAALEEALDVMEFASDPDAAAAALCGATVLAARRAEVERAAEHLDRIGAVRSLLAPEDVHLVRVVEALHALAASWGNRRLEEVVGTGSLRRPDQGREILRRRVPSLFRDRERSREEARSLPSPYLRLLFAGAVEQLEIRETGARILSELGPEEADELVTVHRQGHWFQVGDQQPVNLMSRQPLRRILRAIVESHAGDGPAGRSVDALIETGWPDSVLTRDSGANRVYTAIRSLRDMGLEGRLVTGDHGYRFAADLALRATEADLESVQE